MLSEYVGHIDCVVHQLWYVCLLDSEQLICCSGGPPAAVMICTLFLLSMILCHSIYNYILTHVLPIMFPTSFILILNHYLIL